MNFKIADKKVGPGEDIFFIAEIGINHNQDINLAYDMIDAAANAGCDAAKFQTFRAKDLYVHRSLAGTYHLMGKKIPIFDLHTKLEMSTEWIKKLQKYCNKKGILFFSTPVAKAGTDRLEKAGVPAYKISSYDCTNLPLIQYVATKKKPLIVSTGAATLAEVEDVFFTLRKAEVPFVILQCIAKYPAPYNCANLAVMDTLRNAFQVPIGFSDNGFKDENGKIDVLRIPLGAARAGADMFEVHITTDRSLPGADHGFATLPDELKTMVNAMRQARKEYNGGKRWNIDKDIWGSSIKSTQENERYVRDFAYKCLYATKPIKRGEKLSTRNIGILRPGEHKRGLAPKYFKLATKTKASRSLKAWQPITWDVILNS